MWGEEKKNWTVAQWPKVLFSDESTFWVVRCLAQAHLVVVLNTPEQCHGLITSMPRRIDTVVHVKEAQPSIECIEMNILFRSLTFLFKISFFIDLM